MKTGMCEYLEMKKGIDLVKESGGVYLVVSVDYKCDKVISKNLTRAEKI